MPAEAVTIALVGFFVILALRVMAPQMTPLFTDLSFEDSAGIVTPGVRLDQAKDPPAVVHAAMVAETVTRALVGRTVAAVERDLILETLKHCLGNRTHAANILGISIRTLRNKLNEYSSNGLLVPPPMISGSPEIGPSMRWLDKPDLHVGKVRDALI